MSKKDDNDILPLAAEGSIKGIAAWTRGYVRNSIRDPLATFMRMVVIEVICDPTQVNKEKLDYWQNVLQVRNHEYSKLLPRNTIIAQKVKTGRTTFDAPQFLFPFFPSHLSLPCKPGEFVWAMYEDPNAHDNNLGFWFCRISEPHIGDDVNHTHPGTKLNRLNIETLQEKTSEEFEPNYDMHNGSAVKFSDGRVGVQPGGEMISLNTPRFQGPDVFEKLITETDSSSLIGYEPVPRFRKRPGDISLEGTNNSLIVLGTERTGSHAEYQIIPDYKEYGPVAIHPNEEFKRYAGSIDMVVGRGTLPTTGGNVVSTNALLGSSKNPIEIKKEIAKFPQKLVSPQEGDPDLINDRSRILLSQRTKVDTNFGTANYNSQFQIADSPEGDAAVTIKTDKVRIIARSDISLVVTNFTYNPTSIDNSTVGYKVDNADQTKWASITIKTNGDIVFTPSSEGYIKLGDDTADRALLCTDTPATTDGGRVLPTTTALSNTMGGKFGGTLIPGQGTWAKKILVTGAK